MKRRQEEEEREGEEREAATVAAVAEVAVDGAARVLRMGRVRLVVVRGAASRGLKARPA